MAMETTMVPPTLQSKIQESSTPYTMTNSDSSSSSSSTTTTTTTETNKLIETTNEGETSLPMTTIEPIMTTEPTTTPTLLSDIIHEQHNNHMQHEHDHHDHDHDHADHFHQFQNAHAEEHVHHMPNDDNKANDSLDNAILFGKKDQTTEKLNEIEPATEEQLNQISGELDDDVKDFNNFRHPATLITASQSEEQMQKAKEQEELNTKKAVNNQEEEDPYHAHILSENHDRLAEHEDYQMLSSTEDALSTSTTTTTTTPNPFEEVHTDQIVISYENEATAEPKGSHVEVMSEGRARAINVNAEDILGSSTTSTTTPATPVVNIIEGQHVHQHSEADHQHHLHEHDHDHQQQHQHSLTIENADENMTTIAPDDQPPVYVFNGEGRSVGSGISAAEDDNLSHMNYHFNFVTTERSFHDHDEHKNAAIKELSDVSMDEEQSNENINKSAQFSIKENTGEAKEVNESTTTTTTTTTESTLPSLIAGGATNTTDSESGPQMKITEVTPAGDAALIHPECMDNGKSYKVSCLKINFN